MIEIVEATTKKLQKDFLEFPLKMYKNNPYFVPPLYGDEKKIFSDKNVYYKTCKSVYYNAYRDNVMVGRISGIIQFAHNEKTNEKRARFTRFDAIDDQEVANSLFNAFETWAREEGMTTTCGPLGFSDLEREGLLIEGFDQLSTFEEQYNYEYYAGLIEKCGYQKEVDWVEHKLYYPKELDPRIARIAEMTLKKYNLHLDQTKGKKAFIKKYKDGIFYCIDECYKELYGTVPFTDEMKEQLIEQFLLIVDRRYVGVICDEKDNVIGFGLCFPSIGPALQKSGGRLTVPTLLRLLRVLKKHTVLDLALIGILPEYQKKGINAVILDYLLTMFKKNNIEYCETNLNLEDNTGIKSQWSSFDAVLHKRRRSYIKNI